MSVDREFLSRVPSSFNSRAERPAWATSRITPVLAAVLALNLVLAGCGGGGGGGGGDSSSAAGTGTGVSSSGDPVKNVAVSPGGSEEGTTEPVAPVRIPANTIIPTTPLDAVRLAHQGSFGPTESLVADIQAQGPSAWLISQMIMPQASRYTSGADGSLHRNPSLNDYCLGRGDTCWRDHYSTEPLLWDFYRNAMQQPDQLRQRVAFALSQIVVVSGTEINGTYGFRNYQNALLSQAFGNYREVLKKVSLSPVMGDYLNNVNNHKLAPNENFARELLQLFSIGTCDLNADGTLKTGQCVPTYSNDQVRAYAYALTGWTYPVGGSNPGGCNPVGINCQYYGGDMVPAASYHDTAERRLLSNVVVPAGSTAPQALERVLDSLIAHPNTAPFISKQLIQHLVSSNPSPAYVQRVSAAFKSGRYGDFGTDTPGDMAATVAAILLDTEARGSNGGRRAGKLREPALLFTGVLRALNGKTDGDALGWWWGGRLGQHVFRAPSVFNFYAPDHPVAGTQQTGPVFAIHQASTALERLNFLTYLIDWNGSGPNAAIPNAIGTSVDTSVFLNDAADAEKLVDRLSMLALGKPLQGAARATVVKDVAYWTAARDSANWKQYRINVAAYLIFASPHYQIQY